MANTNPIITIEVNDDAFKAFQASFDKFKKVVDSFSDSFKAVGDAAAKAVDKATVAVEKSAKKSEDVQVSAQQRAADRINRINEQRAERDFQRQLRNLQKMQDAEVKAAQKRLDAVKKVESKSEILGPTRRKFDAQRKQEAMTSKVMLATRGWQGRLNKILGSSETEEDPELFGPPKRLYEASQRRQKEQQEQEAMTQKVMLATRGWKERLNKALGTNNGSAVSGAPVVDLFGPPKALFEANQKRIKQEQAEEEKVARQKKDLFKKVLGDNLVSFYDFAGKIKDIGMSTVGAALGTASLAIAAFESAGSLANLRKQASGAGVSAGSFLSFGSSFERLLNNPVGTLQGIANMQLNLAQRGQLQALTGLSGAQITSRTADQLAPDVIRAIQKRYQENPSLQYAQAFGIDKLVTEDERRRIGSMSSSELESSILRSQQQGQFNRIDPESLKSWTELYNAIQEASAAGKALMGSMGALADILSFLTKSVTEFFQVIRFIVEKLSIPFSQWFSGTPSKGSASTGAANVGGQSAGNAPGTGTAADRRNNPGNLRNVGGQGFQTFGSTEEGFRAMAHQLQLYGQRHNDTIQGIISKWAPSSENNTAAYIANVAKKTGFSSTEHLNLNDPTVLSKLMVAMAQQEGTKNKYTPEGVKLMIQNNTGGSAVVSASAMGAS